MGESKLQRILRDGLEEVAASGSLTPHAISVGRLLARCRTGELGFTVYQCTNDDAHEVRFCPSSCGHRYCRTCPAIRIEKRILHEREHFLVGNHHQVVFTLPPALRDFFSFNMKLGGDLLLRSTSTSVLAVLKKPKFMGGTPGIVSFLHTWNQRMDLHPHVHMLVSGTGLSDDGKLVHTHLERLAPHEVLAAHWRSTFVNMLRAHLREKPDEVVYPEGLDEMRLRQLLVEIKKNYWHVHTFAGTPSQHSLKYNVSYSIGGCIGNRRIKSYDGTTVVITCRSRRDQKKLLGPHQTVLLSREDFIRRYLKHAPAKHQRVIAHAGLYAAAASNKRLQRARLLLRMGPVVRTKLVVKDMLEVLKHAQPMRCTDCGGHMCPSVRLSTGPPRR